MSLPYAEVISRYDSPTTIFYVDPPYWGCEKYYGRDIFTRDDFARLSAQLGGIQGRFILSINDHPEVRDIFRAFSLEVVKIQYTCAPPKNVPVGELLVRNWT